MDIDFPLPTAAPHEPPPGLAELRAHCPIRRVALPTGDKAWLVTKYSDNRTVLADPRFSRAAAARQSAPRARLIPLDTLAITAMDPPDHTRIRALVTPAFTHRRIEQLKPFVEQTAHRLASQLEAEGPPADLAVIFARPLALTVIGHLLGLPSTDYERFRRNTDAYLSVDAHTPEQMRAAVAELKAILGELIAERKKEPGEDLLGVLVAGGAAGRLTDDEITTFGVTLLVAGYETVAAHVTNSLLVLFEHPDQLKLLRDNPAFLPRAVEELLRFTPISPAGGTIRIALEDVTLSGTSIRAGEAVQPSTISANRDDDEFTDPGRLDLNREPGHHLAFGHGIHHCLGAGLARLELKTALSVLLQRFPALRQADPEASIDWQPRKMIRGADRLPVIW